MVTSVQGLLGVAERDRARAEQEQDDKEREAGDRVLTPVAGELGGEA